ncbi:unnamed protein product [Camellia sinensis]
MFCVATIMFLTKFSHLGAHVIKGLTGVSNIYSKNTIYTSFSQSPFAASGLQHGRQRNNISMLHSLGKGKYRKHHFFSSTAADKAQEGGDEDKEKISVTFIDKDGDEKQIKVPIGMSMLEAAHENDIDLEGACEGSLACSTCHVIVMDMEYYNKLEDPTDEENDMLDLAFGLTETSRLGCQVIASPELDGLRLALPAATRNFAVDGFKPKPH